MPRPLKSASPFRYFDSSPEAIRLVVVMECGSHCRCGMSKINSSSARSVSNVRFPPQMSLSGCSNNDPIADIPRCGQNATMK